MDPVEADRRIDAFYRNCPRRFPHTQNSIRKILKAAVGEAIDPRVQIEDFSTEDVLDIKNNLHDSRKREMAILRALGGAAVAVRKRLENQNPSPPLLF